MNNRTLLFEGSNPSPVSMEFMHITDKMNADIKGIMDNSIHEYRSGRLYCTQSGINKIAAICGLNYGAMSKYKRDRFRIDIISSYQMGFFKLTIDYNGI